MLTNYSPGPFRIKHEVNVVGLRNDVRHEGGICNAGCHDSNLVDCGPESRANAELFRDAADRHEQVYALTVLGWTVNKSRDRKSNEECWMWMDHNHKSGYPTPEPWSEMPGWPDSARRAVRKAMKASGGT